MVEIFGDGSGRCGGELCSCEGVPVHHPDKHTGKHELVLRVFLSFVGGFFRVMMSLKKTADSGHIVVRSSSVSLCCSCVSAAGLLRDSGADGSLLVLPEDPLQAGPLCSRDGVFAGGGGHGGSRHSGWTKPGIQ